MTAVYRRLPNRAALLVTAAALLLLGAVAARGVAEGTDVRLDDRFVDGGTVLYYEEGEVGPLSPESGDEGGVESGGVGVSPTP